MTQYSLINDNPPVVLIKNLYSSQEQNKILNELNFLQPKFLQIVDNEPATNENGEYLAAKTSVWLDKVYADRNTSDILKINRKTYEIIEVIDHWFFAIEGVTLGDWTLLSYYENSDYYKPHKDSSYITALYWINNTPKGFIGGDLNFPGLDIKIPYESNTMVMFPGWVEHSVSEIKTITKDNSIKGRFAITQFIGIEP